MAWTDVSGPVINPAHGLGHAAIQLIAVFMLERFLRLGCAEAIALGQTTRVFMIADSLLRRIARALAKAAQIIPHAGVAVVLGGRLTRKCTGQYGETYGG